jgi:hypothetical protein
MRDATSFNQYDKIITIFKSLTEVAMATHQITNKYRKQYTILILLFLVSKRDMNITETQKSHAIIQCIMK